MSTIATTTTTAATTAATAVAALGSASLRSSTSLAARRNRNRPLWRMARRDVRRRPWRTLLVMLLLALPTAFMLGASIIARTNSLTTEQQQRIQLGRADGLIVEGQSFEIRADGTFVDPGGIPEAWPRVEIESDYAPVQVGVKRVRTGILRGELTAPLLDGVYTITKGRAPTSAEEALVSPSLADRLDASIGDTITLKRPAQTSTIVGLVRQNSSTRASLVWVGGTGDWELSQTSSYVTAPSEAIASIGGLTRDSIGVGGDAENLSIIYTIGAIMLFIVGIIITAAFASGARRQLREVGLVGASGGDPAQLRRGLALQGTITGIGGVIGGIVLLGALATVAWRWKDQVIDAAVPLDISIFDLIIVAVMVVLAATVAAWLPARTTARTPLLAALAGRRPLPPVKGRVPIVGLVLVGIGVLALTTIFPRRIGDGNETFFQTAAAAIGIVLGGALCCPWLTAQFGRMATRFGGVTRLTGRDISRHRSRTGPLVASIMAVCAMAIALSTFVTHMASQDSVADLQPTDLVQITQSQYEAVGSSRQNELPEFPIDETLIDALRVVMPGTPVLRLSTFPNGALWSSIGNAYVVSSSDLRAIGMTEAADALDGGTAAALVYGQLPASVTIPATTDINWADVPVEGGQAAGPALTLPVTRIDVDRKRFAPFAAGTACTANECWASPVTLVGRQQAAGTEFDTAPDTVQFWLDSKLSDQQLEDIDDIEIALDLDDTVNNEPMTIGGRILYRNTSVNVSQGPPISAATLNLLIVGAGVLFSLLVTAIGLALGIVEQRDEDTTLIAVGAPPGVRRRLRATTAGLLTLTGAVLAIPIGFLPALVVSSRVNNEWGVSVPFPWFPVLLLMVALPTLAATGAALLTRTPRSIDLSRIS